MKKEPFNRTTIHYQIAVQTADGRNGTILAYANDGSATVEAVEQKIKELRATTGEYAKHWKIVPLFIQRVTTTTETIAGSRIIEDLNTEENLV